MKKVIEEFFICHNPKKIIGQKRAGRKIGAGEEKARTLLRSGHFDGLLIYSADGSLLGMDEEKFLTQIESLKFYKGKHCLKCKNKIPVTRPSNSKYCSKECGGKYVYRDCKACGKTYHSTNYHQLYCSNKCRASEAPPPAWNRNYGVAKCAYCEMQFEKASQHHKYCSKECASKAKLKPPSERSCKCCGKTYVSRRLYCSDECLITTKNKKRKQSENITRQSLYRRDKFTCIYCGQSSIEDGVRLTADHIVPFNKGGTHSIGNLVTCCKKCNSAKCDSMFDNDIIERVQAVVAKRNELLSPGDRASIKEFAKRIGKATRYKV